jgi:hypothetical protein
MHKTPSLQMPHRKGESSTKAKHLMPSRKERRKAASLARKGRK